MVWYKCLQPDCKYKGTAHLGTYKKHMMTHDEEMNFGCDIFKSKGVRFEYKSKGSLMTHIRAKHGGSMSRIFKCVPSCATSVEVIF